MKTLIILAYFLISSGILAFVIEEKIGNSIPKLVLINITVLYICGLIFRDLRVGIIINFLMPFVEMCGGVYLYRKIKNKSENNIFNISKIKELCITPGALIFIVFFAFIWYANQFRVLSSWDEFTHWGLVVKNMCVFNRFGNYSYSTDYFPGYPPGTSLWEYFITKFYGSFHEQYIFRANGWMYLSFIIPIAETFEKRKAFSACLSTIALLLMPAVFFNEYLTTLYVDAFLGVLYGYLMYEVYKIDFQKNEIIQYFFFTVGMCVLCLVKASGVFLSISVGFALVIIVSKHTIESGEKNKRLRICKGLISPLLSVVIALLLGKALWSVHLSVNQTEAAWNTTNITISSILNLIRGGGKPYQYNTLVNFIDALSETDMASYVFSLKFIPWVAIAIIGLIICLVINVTNENKTVARGNNVTNVKIIAVVFLGSLMIYTAGMLALYIFTYSPYEAENLASFTRYMATPLVGIFYFIIRCTIEAEKYTAINKYSIIPYVMLSVLIMCLPLNQFCKQFLVSAQNTSLSIRSKYEGVKRYLPLLDYKKDKIWYISQHDTGFDRWVLRYNMTPIQDGTQYFSWSLGAPYDDSDIWTNDITPSDWLQDLMKRDVHYVYLYQIDERFINDYGCCFVETPKDDTMYKLDRSSQGYKLSELMTDESSKSTESSGE